MKKTVYFLSFFIVVFMNSCFAWTQLPIIDDIDARTYISSFNQRDSKLKFQEVTLENHPKFGDMYNCLLSDNQSTLTFGVRNERIYMLSMLAPFDGYMPAFETLAYVVMDGGMSEAGYKHFHENLIKAFKSGKPCIIDRAGGKEFQMEASQMGEMLLVGISCWEIE